MFMFIDIQLNILREAYQDLCNGFAFHFPQILFSENICQHSNILLTSFLEQLVGHKTWVQVTAEENRVFIFGTYMYLVLVCCIHVCYCFLPCVEIQMLTITQFDSIMSNFRYIMTVLSNTVSNTNNS